MQTSLILKSTQTAGGTVELQRSITHVNPNATAEQILAFTKGLNALTHNTYGETNRVQTINVDTETIPTPTPTKQTATLTLSPNSFTRTQVQQGNATSTVTTTSDYTGTPLVSTSNDYVTLYYNDPVRLNITGNGGAETLTVMIPETENYYAVTATITITT